MRIQTLLMTVAVVVVAAITYYALEFTMPEPEVHLASVTPDEPPIVVQEKAAKKVNMQEAGLN